ncbi:hypothetical protein ARMGADRAFT_1059545 [Armillaria gallica]|uniref:Alpha-1,3-glucosyltransferase n=1 Tax=Armillaria gallica TaxID=47427 RepID=A0A2H3E6N6_ARMGA|nr:hypothetical protein ARMGADRAFT_1059545 [Armillaria gallica]
MHRSEAQNYMRPVQDDISRCGSSSRAASPTSVRFIAPPSAPHAPSTAARRLAKHHPLLLTNAATTLIKLLVGLGPYSGQGTPPDFEAQRHWMEITLHLLPREWYWYELEWWGLDYPPLTAYVSWLCGFVGNSRWFALDTSRGIESEGLKLFMRLTVVVFDAVVWVPAVVWWARCRPELESKASIVTLANPCLLLVDFGHFQYNSVMLGLTSSLAFFLFSFQVHEKTILVPLLPALVLTTKSEWITLFSNTAAFSMWPLLKRDGLGLQYIATLLLWNRLVGSNPFARFDKRDVVKLLSVSVYTAAFTLHLAELLIPAPARYPDLWAVANVLVCTPVFFAVWAWSLKAGMEERWAGAPILTTKVHSRANSLSPATPRPKSRLSRVFD